MTIRVLVVDDQPVVRAGVATMIGTQTDLEVIGEAADGLEAVAKAAPLRRDVVVMDIRMPQLNGIEATCRVIALTPVPPRVVLLTTFDLDEYVFDGLLAGASGFLLKHAPPEEILLAVRAAAAGDALVSPAPMRRLVEHFVRGRPHTASTWISSPTRSVRFSPSWSAGSPTLPSHATWSSARPRIVEEGAPAGHVGAAGRRVATGTYTLAELPGGRTRITFEYAWQKAPMSEALAAPLLRAVSHRGNQRAMERLAGQLRTREADSA